MDKLSKTASPMQVDIYPLPDSLYPQSKDWMAADYAGRVEWLHSMYENRKDELDCFLAAQEQGEAVAWQRRVKPDSGKWLAWEYFAGAIDYDSDPAKFPSRVGRWECEYRALYTHPAPSASPAGVPDSVIVLLNHLETLMDEGKLAEDAIPIEMWNAVSMQWLRRQLSAPKGE